jgi:NTE family protein
VVVNTGDISAVDFTLSPEIKNSLFELGYTTTREFLPKKYAGFTSTTVL